MHELIIGLRLEIQWLQGIYCRTDMETKIRLLESESSFPKPLGVDLNSIEILIK